VQAQRLWQSVCISQWGADVLRFEGISRITRRIAYFVARTAASPMAFKSGSA